MHAKRTQSKRNDEMNHCIYVYILYIIYIYTYIYINRLTNTHILQTVQRLMWFRCISHCIYDTPKVCFHANWSAPLSLHRPAWTSHVSMVRKKPQTCQYHPISQYSIHSRKSKWNSWIGYSISAWVKTLAHPSDHPKTNIHTLTVDGTFNLW